MVRLLQGLEGKYGELLGLKLGGAGDSGEILAAFLDVLIEAKIVFVSREMAEVLVEPVKGEYTNVLVGANFDGEWEEE